MKCHRLVVRPSLDTLDLSGRLQRGRELLVEGHELDVLCGYRRNEPHDPREGSRLMEYVLREFEDVGALNGRLRRLPDDGFAMHLVPRFRERESGDDA